MTPHSRQEDAAAALEQARRAARRCRDCLLYVTASQTVFGQGRPGAALFLLGEQPGHDEDRKGEPFRGAGGRVLEQALELAGVPRDEVYLSYAVKHFKWLPRGKQRVMTRPAAPEIQACSGWLRTELALVAPRVVLCLGATAAVSALGREAQVYDPAGGLHLAGGLAPRVVVAPPLTRLLRARSGHERECALRVLVHTLRNAWSWACDDRDSCVAP